MSDNKWFISIDLLISMNTDSIDQFVKRTDLFVYLDQESSEIIKMWKYNTEEAIKLLNNYVPRIIS